MSDCPTCAYAEASAWQKFMIRAHRVMDRPSPGQLFISSYATTMRIMLGTSEPSWYDRHRDNWIRTGDTRELERMTRHVPA